MKKILLSIMTIALVAVVAVGATRAFFSDTETSEGNTFVAGAIDLKVDSEAHYNGMVCTEVEGQPDTYVWEEESTGSSTYPELIGQPCFGTWSLRDIDSMDDNRFFDFADIKPGDSGEITLSLHVYDNDAWGRGTISKTRDSDENGVSGDYDDPFGMTEPEDMVDGTLNNTDGTADGDLDDSLLLFVWEDFGIDGIAGNDDTGEGDNVYQPEETPVLSGYASDLGTSWPIDFGALEASTTYYYGVAWSVDTSVGNIMQSDSYAADIAFEIVQRRHNPNPWP